MVLSVVGNKTDLEQKRAVSREEAFLFASSIGGTYFETSAINGGRGIEQIFISTALGLLRMSNDGACSSIKRYESEDSLLSCNDVHGKLNELSITENSIRYANFSNLGSLSFQVLKVHSRVLSIWAYRLNRISSQMTPVDWRCQRGVSTILPMVMNSMPAGVAIDVTQTLHFHLMPVFL